MPPAKVIKIELNLGRLPTLLGKAIFPLRNLWSNHRLLALLLILLTQLLLVGGWDGVSAYQANRHIKEGDKHFSWERYQEALTSFQKADSAWKGTLFLDRVRESPTAWRVEKANTEVQRLTRSHENYLIGIKKFEDKKWKDSVGFLSKVEEDGQDYSDAQAKIKEANKQIAAAKKKAEEDKKGQVAGTSTQVIYRTIVQKAPPPPPKDTKTEQKVSDLEKKVTELETKPPQNLTLSLSESEINAVVLLGCVIDWVDESNYDFVLGSGTIYDPSGLVYTNRHVVANSDGTVSPITVCVVVNNAGVYYALLYAYSSSTDVAILVIYEAAEGYSLPNSFPYLTLGSSGSLQLGDDLWLAGYPTTAGGEFTLTKGIVSTKSGDDIGTDASISYGNSGGAALDKNKKFVGIPTGGSSEGLGVLGYVIGIDRVLSLTDWVTSW